MLQCTILGVDPMQRLWRNIGGALPHCGAQMLELQVVQYEAGRREEATRRHAQPQCRRWLDDDRFFVG